MIVKSNTIKNIFTSLILQLVIVVCGFIVPKLIIENFGSAVNGLISSINQFLSYIILLESGIGPVIKATLYKPIVMKDKKEIENILGASERFFKKISYIFLFYIFILCVFYPLILQNEFNIWFTISLLIIISISTFSEYYFGMTYRLYLQSEQKTYVISSIQILTTILNTLIIILLIQFKFNIQMIKLISAFIFVLRPLLQNLYVKKRYNINLKNIDKNYKLNKKWDALAQHVAAVIHENTDIAVLTFLSTMQEVSVYSVYNLIVKGVKNLAQSFTGGIDALFGNMLAKNEKENLNKSFNFYELFYFNITTIIFGCTLILIRPFINVYTQGIVDVNYNRPLFGLLLILAEFFWCIRQPYNDLTKAAGHFKETMKGAWVEAFLNLFISIILVFKFGIIGVAIGTLIAMIIRTFEFVYHTSKYILNRNIWMSLKKIGVILIELVFLYFINTLIFKQNLVSTYVELIIYAICVFFISFIIVLSFNLIVYKKDLKNMIDYIKNDKELL